MNAYPAIQETAPESFANEQLAAFVADAETRAAVQQAIGDRWPNAILHEGGLSAALGTLSQDPTPPLLIVDVSGTEDPSAGIRSLMALCEADTRIVALGTVNDIAYYRGLIALGISEYIVKPLDPGMLASALDGARRPRPHLQAVEPERTRNVVAVVGARGGVGATTTAVNLAWIAAHELDRTCAIVDLDLQFGTVALQLDLEPSHGLREALENPDRIDGLFIASAMSSESENLFVLSAEEPFEERIRFAASACATLLEALPDELSHVFLDIPARAAIADPDLLGTADRIVLVSDPGLAGMRDLARLARICREAAPAAALHPVINRAGMAKKGELAKADIAKGADLPIRHTIGYDATLAAVSATNGKPFPLIASRSPTVKAMRGLARDIVGTQPKQVGVNSVDRLKSLLRKG